MGYEVAIYKNFEFFILWTAQLLSKPSNLPSTLQNQTISYNIPPSSANMPPDLSIKQLEAKLFNLRSIRDSMTSLAENFDNIPDPALKARCVRLRKYNLEKWCVLELLVLYLIGTKQLKALKRNIPGVTSGESTDWTKIGVEEESSESPVGNETLVSHLLEMIKNELL